MQRCTMPAWPEARAPAQGYVVLNRPYAFQQWAHQALPGLEEDYVLMAEPDHIFLKPPALVVRALQAQVLQCVAVICTHCCSGLLLSQLSADCSSFLDL